jgi:hypothetical protein
MGTEHDSRNHHHTCARPKFSHESPWGDFAASGGRAAAQDLPAIEPSKRNIIPQWDGIADRFRMDNSLPWTPPRGDINIREVGKAGGASHFQTNVAWSVFKGATLGFEPGHLAQGADELALNILNQFVPPGSDGYPPVAYSAPHWAPNVTNEASRTAHLLESAFRYQFIYGMDNKGGTLSGSAIRQWIDEHQGVIHNPRAK